MISLCPSCFEEHPRRIEALTALEPGIVYCAYHGQMRASDIPAIARSALARRWTRQREHQMKFAFGNIDKS
jgi:hypothetical protein